MANYCVYVPSIGKNLFKDLKTKFEYPIARDIFLHAVNKVFLERYKNTLVLDDEGVPTLDSLLSNSYIQNRLGDLKIIESLKKEYSSKTNTIDNYNSLVKEAEAFNKTNSYSNRFVAIVHTNQEGNLELQFLNKNEGSVNKFTEQLGTVTLNEALMKVLKPLGITIGTLTQAELSAGRLGVTDFSKVKDLTSNIASIIRVANGQEGAEVLSEECSHLIIGMLKDHPLIQRAINYLINNVEELEKVLGSEYQDNIDFHEGDLSLVAEEALGKILRNNLLKTTSLELKNKSLFERLFNYIKKLFKPLDSNILIKSLNDIETSMSDVAQNILNGTLSFNKQDLSNSYREVEFNALSDRINKNIEILKNASYTEIKRIKMSNKHYTKKQDDISNVRYIASFAEKDKDTIQGIMSYSFQALTQLKVLSGQLSDIDKISDPIEKFKILRSVKDYIESYQPFIEEMYNRINEEEQEEDNMFAAEFKIDNNILSIPSVIDQLHGLSTRLYENYKNKAIPAFAEFLKPFMGEEIIIKGQKMTVKDLLKVSKQDISFLDMWLDNMGKSSSVILQGFDAAVKNAKDEARKDSIDTIEDIQNWAKKAEKAGYSTFDWMFEYDSEGNKTGNLVDIYNWYNYEKDKNEFLQSLNEKYKNVDKELSHSLKKNEMSQWFSDHLIYNDKLRKRVPNYNKYPQYLSIAYSNLSEQQKELLQEYKDIKTTLDKLVGNKNHNKAIQIRKSKSRRLLDTLSSPSTLFDNIKGLVAESFLDNQEDDDTQFGSRTGLTDFKNREYLILPKLYTTSLNNPNELSDDVIGALMCYAHGSHNYDKMSNILDALETGRHIVSDITKTEVTRGNKTLKAKLKTEEGVLETPTYKNKTNITERLDSFFSSQVYGKYIKDQGTIGKVNVNKAVNTLLKLGSITQMGFNWLSNIANVNTTVAMQNIEAAAGEFFSAKELAKADTIYAKLMLEHLPNIGNRYANDKLSVLMRVLDIKQDFKGSLESTQKKNLLERLFGSRVAFIGQDAGDHWLYNRTAIAMLLHTKVYKNGIEQSLWDSLKYITDNKGKITNIKVDSDIKDSEGNSINLNKIGRIIADVNQGMMGIYNQDDANAAHQVALGRLLLQYRKWIKPQMNKRFMASQYNVLLGREEEGYYRTLVRLGRDLVRGKFQYSAIVNELSDHQKRNINRALFEVGQFIVLNIFIGVITGGDDDEDVLEGLGFPEWSSDFIKYSSVRLSHELSMMTPLQTGFIRESLKTVRSPMAVLNTIQSSLNLLGSLFTPEDWFKEIERGRYKGMTRLEKHLWQAPIPGISNFKNMETAIYYLEEQTNWYDSAWY